MNADQHLVYAVADLRRSPTAARDFALMLVEAAQRELAQAETFEQAREVTNKTRGFMEYLRRNHTDRHAVGLLAAQWLRGVRWMGTWLEANVNHDGGGDRKSESRDETAMRDLPDGVTKSQSSRWQRVASVHEQDFDLWIHEILTGDDVPSLAGLYRIWQMYFAPDEERARQCCRPDLDDAHGHAH